MIEISEKDIVSSNLSCKKFRKKPIIVEALQLRWDTWNEMCDFAHVGRLKDGKPEGKQVEDNHIGQMIGLMIPTSEGLVHAVENDWIIKDEKGTLYSCKPDIFEMTYELVE